MGIGQMGVGKMGIGEMGIGEMGWNRFSTLSNTVLIPCKSHRPINCKI